MTKRYTISGLDHMIKLLSQNPTLMCLNSFAGIRQIAEKAKKEGAKCSCNVSKVYKDHIKDFELALQNMGNGDHLIVKRILGVDQICFHTKKATGQFQLVCI